MNGDTPLGVKIIGILWIISGLAVYINILRYVIGPIDISVMQLSPYDSVRGILYIFIGLSLIKLKQWARLAAIIILAIEIPIAIYIIIFKDAKEGLIYGITPLIVNSIVLYYLTRNNIKLKFRVVEKKKENV